MDPLDRAAIDWLLASAEPGIRMQARRDLLGEDSAAEASVVEKGHRQGAPRGQQPDGSFGVDVYSKWHGAHWRLGSLVELGIAPGHPAAVAAYRDGAALVGEPAPCAIGPGHPWSSTPMRVPGGPRARGGRAPRPRRGPTGPAPRDLPHGMALGRRRMELRQGSRDGPFLVLRERAAALGHGCSMPARQATAPRPTQRTPPLSSSCAIRSIAHTAPVRSAIPAGSACIGRPTTAMTRCGVWSSSREPVRSPTRAQQGPSIGCAVGGSPMGAGPWMARGAGVLPGCATRRATPRAGPSRDRARC